MKKEYLLTLLAAAFLASCSDDNSYPTGNEGTPQLVSPDLNIRLASTQNQMSGILEAYPCKAGSSIYFGNYVQNKLSPLPGYYRLNDGEISGKNNRLITLPTGIYNIIYWGTSKPEMPTYANPVIREPQITLGGDLSQQYYGLRKISADTTYHPTFDLVYAVKSLDVGVEDLNAALQRVVAGLKIVVKNADNSTLNPAIAGMEIHIGSIAEKQNAYTAEPSTQTCTVEFPLAPNADNTQMSNAAVMLFPSGANPPLTLFINLKNGNVKVFKQTLASPLKANQHLTLTLTLGEIFTDLDSGTFTVDNWQEEHQTIDIPTLN